MSALGRRVKRGSVIRLFWRRTNNLFGGAITVGMDKSLICTDDSSKKTDPYGELKVFGGSSSRGLAVAICERLKTELPGLHALL